MASDKVVLKAALRGAAQLARAVAEVLESADKPKLEIEVPDSSRLTYRILPSPDCRAPHREGCSLSEQHTLLLSLRVLEQALRRAADLLKLLRLALETSVLSAEARDRIGKIVHKDF